MALTTSDKKEIETLIRKEIKDFLGSNTVKQFETKLVDNISKEMQRGGLRRDVKDIIIKSFQDYFTVMYQQRGFWEQKFRNA